MLFKLCLHFDCDICRVIETLLPVLNPHKEAGKPHERCTHVLRLRASL